MVAMEENSSSGSSSSCFRRGRVSSKNSTGHGGAKFMCLVQNAVCTSSHIATPYSHISLPVMPAKEAADIAMGEGWGPVVNRECSWGQEQGK